MEPTIKLIGYARVSTREQNLDRQIAALTAAGCHQIFSEKMSGKSTKDRPELERAINALGTDWVLVVAEWDRATRSMLDGIALMERVAKRGCYIKILDRPQLDLSGPVGRGLLAFLSAMAEEERRRTMDRAKHGREAAKKRGVHMGRKFVLSEHQRKLARTRLHNGESARVIAKDLGVSHTTILRAV